MSAQDSVDGFRNDVVSDEPNRVRILTQHLFDGQHRRYETRRNGYAEIDLAMGSDAADDAAVFDFRGSGQLVASSDYIRGTGFSMYEFGLISDYDLGYYLVSANVSDIAAMGARQFAFLSVVRYPKSMTDRKFIEIFDGIRDACANFDTANVGGDIGTAEEVILSGTALGLCQPGAALTRRGARVGDRVAISKPTGVAGAARDFFRLTEGSSELLDEDTVKRLVETWSRPQPEVLLGKDLGENQLATSCQDSSDGLKATLEQIAAASNVALHIYEEKIPLDASILKVAPYLGRDPVEMAFTDSVDFALVFTANNESIPLIRDLGHEIYEIGEVKSGLGACLVSSEGEVKPIPGETWRHA